MPSYGGYRTAITPSAGVANWVLETIANTGLLVQEVSWGGGVTTSTAMETKIARDSAIGTGARTAGDVQRLNTQLTLPATPNFYSTTYASTQPTIVAGALFGTMWNAHGGVIRWLAAPGEEFTINGAISLECRAVSGTATSSYHCVWVDL